MDGAIRAGNGWIGCRLAGLDFIFRRAPQIPERLTLIVRRLSKKSTQVLELPARISAPLPPKTLSRHLNCLISPNQLIAKGLKIIKTWHSEHIQLDKLDIEIKEKGGESRLFSFPWNPKLKIAAPFRYVIENKHFAINRVKNSARITAKWLKIKN